MPQVIGVPKEQVAQEKRVATVPEIVEKLRQLGFGVVVQAGAGAAAAVVLAWRLGVLHSLMHRTFALVADILRLRWSDVRGKSDYRSPGALRMPHGPVIAAGTLVFLLLAPR